MKNYIAKALTFVFCISLLTGACSKDESETSQTNESPLKGKVKVITENNYEGTEINGVIQKTSLNHTSVLKFNVNGQITNEGFYTYLYNDKGKLIEKRISENEVFKYIYDEKGNILEEDFYFKDQIQDKEIYKTDALGRIIETTGYYGNNERVTTFSSYNNAGNLIEINRKNLEGVLKLYAKYDYDSNRNLTKETYFFDDGSIDFRNTYKYLKLDETGNWIERLSYYAHDPDYIDELELITVREIEYYQ